MSVQRNVIANFLGSAWSAALGLAILPAYVHFLGIEAYGLMGFFVALQAWLTILDLGLTPTLNREMARFSAGQHTAQSIRDLLRTLEIVYSVVALLLAAVIAASASWIVEHWLRIQSLSPTSARSATLLMALAIAFQWMGVLYRSAAIGLQDQVWLSACIAAIASLRVAVTVAAMSLWGAGIESVVALQALFTLAETGALAWRVRRRLPAPPQPPRFRWESLQRVWKFAMGLAAITILATLLTQVDKLLLAAMLPLDAYGYFSLALAVVGALSMSVSAVNNAAYPRLCELADRSPDTRFAEEYHRFAQILSVALLPAGVTLCVFPFEVIHLWTGDTRIATQVAPLVRVWVLGSVLNGVMHIPYSAQLAHGSPRLAMIMNTAMLAVIVPATLLLVPRYGAMAAGWIWTATNVTYVVVCVGLMHRTILRGEKQTWYLQDVLAPLASVVTVELALSAFHPLLFPMSRGGEFALLASVLAAATLSALLSTPAGVALLRRTFAAAPIPLPFRRPDDCT